MKFLYRLRGGSAIFKYKNYEGGLAALQVLLNTLKATSYNRNETGLGKATKRMSSPPCPPGKRRKLRPMTEDDGGWFPVLVVMLVVAKHLKTYFRQISLLQIQQPRTKGE